MKQQPLSVFRDTAGRYRWVAVSGTAFRADDGAIISTAALADDVARADRDGDYGPILWHHDPDLALGSTDFNAMDGPLLVESGTFRSEAIGATMAGLADQLQVSLNFDYDKADLDDDGVFHSIRRVERSLLPIGTAADPYTAVMVTPAMKHGRKSMDPAKEKSLRETIGDELTDELLRSNREIQARAQADGVEFKNVRVALKDASGWPAGVPFGDVLSSEFTDWYNSAVVSPILDMIAQVRAQFVQPAPELRSAGSRLSDTQAPMPATKAAELGFFDPVPALAGGRLDQIFGGAFDHTPHANGRS